MKKKYIFLAIIGTYLFFILSSPIGLAISSEIAFDIKEKEIIEPIQPSESKEITFKVKYRLELGTLGKMFYLNRRIGRVLAFGFLQFYFFKIIKKIPPATLNLTIQKPDWCEAELNKYEVELSYNNEYEEADVKLSFSLNEDAPAFEKEDIIIKADFLGIGSIGASFNSTNITFMSAYISNISVEAVDNFTITPLKEIEIPINVTNNGNGQTKVNILDLEKDNWNISSEQDNIIDVGETKEIIINIKAPKKFENETITFTLESISTVETVNETYRKGDNVEFSITFYNDKSLEDDDNGIDIIASYLYSDPGTWVRLCYF